MSLPLDRVYVDSELEELQAIVLHSPGDAHRNIMPEHVEAVLSLSDFLYRHARLEASELDSLVLHRKGRPEQGVALSRGDDALEISWKAQDGSVGTLALGEALSQVFLENPQYILFDDIVDENKAMVEYERFERVIRTVAPFTYSFSGLVHDALHRMHMDLVVEAEFFERLERFCPPEERHNARMARRYFNDHGARRFLHLLMTGRDHLSNYVFHPLPNLIFTRDLAAVVGNKAVLCSAAKQARLREMVLSWLVFTTHPIFSELQAAGKMGIIDMLGARAESATPELITVEGGDILHLAGDTLLVGVGERTRLEGVIELASRLWAGGAGGTPIQRIVAIDILAKRASMHLDTIFTLIDTVGDEFEAMVYGPYVQQGDYGALRATVLEPGQFKGGKRPSPGDLQIHKRRSLSQLFMEIGGWRLRPLFCGGHPEGKRPDPLYWSDPKEVFNGALANELRSKREQWTDGANLFALAPGIVTTYARNRGSIKELAGHGFLVVTPDQFCANSLHYMRQARGSGGQRIVIPMGGSELSRGRGGQRCMTLPLLRSRTSRSS